MVYFHKFSVFNSWPLIISRNYRLAIDFIDCGCEFLSQQTAATNQHLVMDRMLKSKDMIGLDLLEDLAKVIGVGLPYLTRI